MNAVTPSTNQRSVANESPLPYQKMNERFQLSELTQQLKRQRVSSKDANDRKSVEITLPENNFDIEQVLLSKDKKEPSETATRLSSRETATGDHQYHFKAT